MASHSIVSMLMRSRSYHVDAALREGQQGLQHPMDAMFWPHDIMMMSGRTPPSEYTVTFSLAVIGALVTAILAFTLRPTKTHYKYDNPQEEEEKPNSAATARLAGDDALSEARQPSSISRIYALTSINFAYGFAMACQGLLVVPSEAKYLYPRHSSEALAAMAIICGISQLAGPEAGHYSDVFRSSLGRRRPILIVCAAALWTTNFGCWFLSSLGWRTSFIITYFFMQMGWNIIYATAQGLVPDLVLEERHGLAGSSSAAHVLSGSLLAFVFMMVFPEFEYHWYYGITAVLTATTCVVVCASADEVSTKNIIVKEDDAGMWGFLERYKLDINRYWDFFLLMVTKTIYCALVVSKGFLMYFLRDAFDFSDSSQEKDLMVLLGQVSMAAEGSAVLAALTVMFYFDKSSGTEAEDTPLFAAAMRKPWSQWAVCLGSVWMAIWWNGPTVLAIQRSFNPMSAGEAQGSWTTFMLVGNCIWGLGQGAYLAGDQALALALLPDRKEASRYLSFNCLCAFIGTSIGGLIVGGLLAVLGSGAEKGYSFPGYVGVFLYASVSSAALSVVSFYIRVPPNKAKALTGP